MRHATRAISALLALVLLAGCVTQETTSQTAAARQPGQHQSTSADRQDFADLEQRFQARLGVYAVDTGSGKEVTHRADERWAFCSTMKTFAAATVLRHSTPDELNRRINYTRADLVSHSPMTEKHVDMGMPLRAVLRAAIRESDNTAQNLLLRELGGPAGLQRQLRALGDTTSHVDRREPELNTAIPGDVRDTSTPRALATDLREVMLGDALPRSARDELRDAMRNAPSTADLVRAGVPADWQVEDKSGAGEYGTRNDIAVLRPPDRAPIVLAIMSNRSDSDAEYDDALIAETARSVVTALR